MRPNSSPARTIFFCARLAILPISHSLLASSPFQWATFRRRVCLPLLALCVLLTCFALLLPQRALAAIPVEWVTVTDAGNSPAFASGDPVGGIVDVYQISRTEITNSQYVEFLNAVDFHRTNTLGLYNPALMTDDARGGIVNNVNEHYAVKPFRGNNPVIGVDWFDALRFANWVHNGQGVTDQPITEVGAYTLLGGTHVPSNQLSIVRNAGATVTIPTRDEWYKAAYYKGGSGNAGYWLYPTKSDAQPYSAPPPGQDAPVQSRSANFYNPAGGTFYDAGFAVTRSPNIDNNTNYLTDVGAYTQSLGPYGTVDQAGNVWEWTEDYVGGGTHDIVGGGFGASAVNLTYAGRINRSAGSVDFSLGFRLARAPSWSAFGDGRWSDAYNWTTGRVVPNDPQARAYFLDTINKESVITLDGDRTVGTVVFNSAYGYEINSGSSPGPAIGASLASSASLTIGGPTQPGNITVLKGSHTISAPLMLGPVNSEYVTIDIAADSALTISGAISGGNGTLLRKNGKGTLTINGPQTYGTNSWVNAGGGTLNINTNPGTPNSAAGPNPYLQIYGNDGIRVVLGADMDLKGLYMSFAAAGRQTLDLNSSAGTFHAVRVYDSNLTFAKTDLWNAIRHANAPGAADALDGIIDSGLHPGAAIGLARIGDHILIRPTRLGDLNLDGNVTIADFIDLAAHFNATGTWQEGDMNGDGTITISDFIDLASNFNTSYSGEVWPLSEADQAALSSFAAAHGVSIPEPALVGLGAIAGWMLLMRRGRDFHATGLPRN